MGKGEVHHLGGVLAENTESNFKEINIYSDDGMLCKRVTQICQSIQCQEDLKEREQNCFRLGDWRGNIQM